MKAILYRNIVILVYVLLLPLVGLAQRAGDLDRSFNYGRGENYGFNHGNGKSTNSSITSAKVLPNGKIIAVGGFSIHNGVPRGGIVRLNPDGSVDNSFKATGIYGIYETQIQPDGKIIIGGVFTTRYGDILNRIARLNSDGSLDTSFHIGTGIEGGQFGVINSIILQPNGKIIVAGSFASYNGALRNNIARINSDGSLDSSFDIGTGTNGRILTSALQPDGKILIGGSFTVYNSDSTNNFARLNSDGSLDSSFSSSTSTVNQIHSIALQADGRILVSGSFLNYNNVPRNNLVRVNIDGSLDLRFNPTSNLNSIFFKIAIQPNGKIMLVGFFNTINGAQRGNIVRLNSDGTSDGNFSSFAGANSYVNTIDFQSNGEYIIGGQFSSYEHHYTNRIARVKSNGTADRNFYLATGPNEMVNGFIVQPDRKIIVRGLFSTFNGDTRIRLARINADGSLDVNFDPNSGPNQYDGAMILQPDGKIIVSNRIAVYNTTTRLNIARLNTDGSFDNSFNPTIGQNDYVSLLGLQPNGKIIISLIRNGDRPVLTRLNSNGSLDMTFNAAIQTDDSQVRTIAIQPDGKILIGGRFTTNNGTINKIITRLNSDGSLDPSFIMGFETPMNRYPFISSITLQSDNKIIITGSFDSPFANSSAYLARLNNNGSVDSTFLLGSGPDGFINDIDLQSDGKINIAGGFNTYNGSARNKIARLFSNGSLDTSFNILRSNFDQGNIYSIKSLPDGKIILAGSQFLSHSGLSTPGILRIHGNDCPPPTTIDVSISGNLNFCLGDSVTLTSSQLSGNLWSNGETTRSITVKESGVYTVRTTLNGCTSSISNPVVVSVDAPLSPQLILENEPNYCFPNQVVLSVAGNYNRYLWNTGDTTRSISVRVSGRYSARVLDTSGCWSFPASPLNILFDSTYCSINIRITGIDSLQASIEADNYQWFLNGLPINYSMRIIPILGDGVYTVRAFSNGQASPMSGPFLITSSRKSTVTKFEVYPNPATNKVTINTSGTGTLELLNTLGQIVISQPATESIELNISHLARGVYTIKFNGASKMLVVR